VLSTMSAGCNTGVNEQMLRWQLPPHAGQAAHTNACPVLRIADHAGAASCTKEQQLSPFVSKQTAIMQPVHHWLGPAHMCTQLEASQAALTHPPPTCRCGR
jgi:hypothetical protein